MLLLQNTDKTLVLCIPHYLYNSGILGKCILELIYCGKMIVKDQKCFALFYGQLGSFQLMHLTGLAI